MIHIGIPYAWTNSANPFDRRRSHAARNHGIQSDLGNQELFFASGQLDGDRNDTRAALPKRISRDDVAPTAGDVQALIDMIRSIDGYEPAKERLAA